MFDVTFDDLTCKIGKLVIENEMLYKRLRELEAQLVATTPVPAPKLEAVKE